MNGSGKSVGVDEYANIVDTLLMECDRDTLSHYIFREKLVEKYAWAIPNEEALDAICGLDTPITEMGAGLGYWAYLLATRGCEVRAYDAVVEDNTWTVVNRAVSGTVTTEGGLFLCWPPYDTPMGFECLVHHVGPYVIYVGEGWGGCTGCDLFHEYLKEHYRETQVVDIPRWPGVNDRLSIWENIV